MKSVDFGSSRMGLIAPGSRPSLIENVGDEAGDDLESASDVAFARGYLVVSGVLLAAMAAFLAYSFLSR